MGLASKKNNVDSYFKLMKNWDTESKKDIILKLTKSIEDKTKENHDFSSCFGAWEDERSAEEIIEDMRKSRVDKPDNEEF